MGTSAPLSLEATILKAAAQWGVSWPNAWWSGGNNNYNDCAKFMGWLLGDPSTYLVSDIQLRRGYDFHAGSAGVQRGDIVGWNWSGGQAGQYDHTGICTRVVGDTVFTLDANSGATDSVGEYGRNRAYITSYVRPAYPSFAGETGTPITTTLTEEDEMFVRTTSDSKSGKIKKGYGYKQVGDGPFIMLSNLESIFVKSFSQIGGDDFEVLVGIYGVATFEVNPNAGKYPVTLPNKDVVTFQGPGKLTGQRTYL